MFQDPSQSSNTRSVSQNNDQLFKCHDCDNKNKIIKHTVKNLYIWAWNIFLLSIHVIKNKSFITIYLKILIQHFSLSLQLPKYWTESVSICHSLVSKDEMVVSNYLIFSHMTFIMWFMRYFSFFSRCTPQSIQG